MISVGSDKTVGCSAFDWKRDPLSEFRMFEMFFAVKRIGRWRS